MSVDTEDDDDRREAGEPVTTEADGTAITLHEPHIEQAAGFFAKLERLRATFENRPTNGAFHTLLEEVVKEAKARKPNQEVMLRPLPTMMPASMSRMRQRADKLERPIETPWPDFNEQLPGGGFWPGLHMLTGGTGAGKSAWALQLGLYAARNNVAVVYGGLELDEFQVALRLTAEEAAHYDGQYLGWSDLYTGGASPDQIKRAEAAAERLRTLDLFMFNDGGLEGWTATTMRSVAQQMQFRFPEQRRLMVIDFLQLIAAEEGDRSDPRERIGKASYTARAIAREYNTAVVVVSSISRSNYKGANDIEALAAAGLDADRHGTTVVERTMRHPYAFVAMGKEAGEIEYSADSVIAAITLPKDTQYNRQVVFAMAKLRAGCPGWCALNFNGLRFTDDPSHGAEALGRIAEYHKEKASNPAKLAKPNGAKSAAATTNGADDHDL
jgi:replicative DNA helicase